jgi:hypothetical protein
VTDDKEQQQSQLTHQQRWRNTVIAACSSPTTWCESYHVVRGSRAPEGHVVTKWTKKEAHEPYAKLDVVPRVHPVVERFLDVPVASTCKPTWTVGGAYTPRHTRAIAVGEPGRAP